MAAKGFGKSVEPPTPAPATTGGEEGGGKAPGSDGLSGVGSWEKEYKVRRGGLRRECRENGYMLSLSRG